MSIKAIETCWRGIKYRSRTEARWAVFLDELRVAPQKVAFTHWGDNVFISNESQEVSIAVRGSHDIGGAPDVAIGAARVATAERFGVEYER